MLTVYVLYSEKYEKTYVGYTSNFQQRILSQNDLGKNGWTISYRPWKVINTEEYMIKSAAMKREKELKTGVGCEFIKSLLDKR